MAEKKLIMITKDNADMFEGMGQEALLKDDLVLGVGCLMEGEPAGAALIDTDGDRLTLASIFVPPDLRHQGIGSLLLKGTADMAEAGGVTAIDAYLPDDTTEEFFLENGYLTLTGSPRYSFAAGGLLASPKLSLTGSEIKNCVQLDVLNKRQKEALLKMMSKLGMLSRLTQYDGSRSFVYLEKETKPTALLFSSYHEDTNTLMIDHLINDDEKHPVHTMSLIAALAERLKSEDIPGLAIGFIAASSKIEDFTRKLLGEGGELVNHGNVIHAVRAVQK